MIDRKYLTSGDVKFTVVPPADYCEKHDLPDTLIYRLAVKWRGTSQEVYYVFRKLIDGWNYVGIVDRETGAVRLTKSSQEPLSSIAVKVLDRVLQRVFAGEQDKIAEAGFILRKGARKL